MPEELTPAEVVTILFPYLTAYQILHRTAKVKRGESVLVHGAAGRVSVAALELGAVAAGQLCGTFRRAIVPRSSGSVRLPSTIATRISGVGFVNSPRRARTAGELGIEVAASPCAMSRR